MIDTLILARIQFAATITFHILFPTINIALCWLLLMFKILYDYTQDPKWMDIYRFWIKIFALCFVLGIVSGVTMPFQFGINWPGFMERADSVAGPLLSYEVLTAFFLEATFLGVMLFGQKRVPNYVYNISIFLVALGTTLSAFWILILNSWMQTPSGYEYIDNKIHAVNWCEILFNPSMPYRISHMLLASLLTASFLIAGISAYRMLQGDKSKSVFSALKITIFIAAIVIPIQMFIGDAHGRNTLKHQPAKIAAIEAIWETAKDVPLILFAIPDQAARKNLFEISIPRGASLILKHDPNAELTGLNEFGDKIPPVFPVFWSFRIMVGVGLLMLIVSWTTCVQILRKKNLSRVILIILTLMSFSGWISTVAGWYVTEIGRQPYIIYNVIEIFEVVTNSPKENVASILIMYLALYIFLTILFVFMVFFLSKKKAQQNNTITKERN
ncbi:MAG: cytochrome ubiquinol oxidase subunit I [Rickettsiaceae bacterium]